VRIITDVAIFMLQLSSAELPANWAQWWWWRFNGAARLAASFGGAAIFCVVVLGPKLLVLLGVSWAAALVIPWWWQTFLVMSLTTVLWITVALLTKPDPEPLLRSFHQRARPLGWWAPFRQENRVQRALKSDLGGSVAESRSSASQPSESPSPWPSPDGRGSEDLRSILRGIFIAVLGATATSLFILGLSEAWFGRFVVGALALGAAAGLFTVFHKLTKTFLEFLTLRATGNDGLSQPDASARPITYEKKDS
jgi:solute:Na+ symporter, SSS family